MSHPLQSIPADDIASGLAVEPLSATQVNRYADDLGAVHVASYPVGHPDHAAHDAAAAAEEMRSISRGELLGPVLDVSRLALYDHRIVGACVIVDREGTPPFGGPWVLDVFRDPACPVRGIGSALLVSALAAARSAGLDGVSLAVSHENEAALRLYRRLGFVDIAQSLTLALPP
jgi:GNAT superfamily N-acetyltransferase